METILARATGWAAALAAGLALVGCAGLGRPLESPRITLADLRVQDSRKLETAIEVVLRVTNPNETALDIRGLHADLELNGRSFANGASSAPALVPPFGSETLSLVMHSSVIDLFRALLELPRNETLHYRLKGRLRAEAAGVPAFLPFESEGRVALSPASPRPNSP
ncbi:MAG: LEA type 2 family protein [Desulfobacterales bacterium]